MEMAPLLDVIFLLLTFFIYSFVLTVRAEVLPVNLPSLSAGQAAADREIAGITIGRGGGVFLNRKPITRRGLERRLAEWADRPEPPAIFLALDTEAGGVDRGPILIDLIDTLRRLGIEEFQIVGRPGPNGGGRSPEGEDAG